MKSTTIRVGGMHCRSCAKLIAESLRDLNGVRDARVSLEHGTAEVDYDPAKIDEHALRDAIRQEGYEVR